MKNNQNIKLRLDNFNNLYPFSLLSTDDKIIQKATLENFYYLLGYLEGIFMDQYLLARLFRSFNKKSKEDYYSEDPRFIIVYTGTYHTGAYRNFLESIDSIKVCTLKGGDEIYTNNCLDISKVYQPFFHNKNVQ